MGSIQDAINTFRNAVYGKDVRAALVDVAEAVAGQVINLDTGLTQSGYAADAKAVGDRFATVNSSIATNRDNIQANSGQIGTINQTLAQHNSAIATNRDNIQANSGQISTINQTIASMDTRFSEEIDEVLDLIVPEYSSDETYEIGEFCRKDNVLYQCTTRAVAEAWNALHWNATTVGEALNISGLVTAYYDRQGTYAVGDYVIYDGGMYRCKKAHSASGSWVAANWDPVTVTEEIGNMFGTLADDYSVTNTYEIGDYVVYGGKLYRCKIRAVTENWTAAHWDEVQIQSMLRALRDEIDTRLSADEATIASLMENTVASVFSATKVYSAGDYVIYNGKLYRFTADHAAGAWVGTDATAIVLGDEVSDLKSALSESEETVTRKMTLVKSNNLVTDSDFTSGYMAENGRIYSSTGLRYSKKITVTEGDVVRTYYLSGGVWQRQSMRFVTVFNGNIAVASKGTQNVSSFTVPAGVDGIVITSYNGTNTMICIDYEPTEYEEYFDPYYLSTYDFVKDILPPVEIPEMTPAGHNMVNLDELVIGYYYGSSVGRKISFSSTSGYRAAVMPVEPNTDYYINSDARFWAFTDDDDIVISYGEDSGRGIMNSGSATKFYFSNSRSVFENETEYGTSYALIIAKGNHGASTRIKKPEFISGITQNMMDAKYGCALPIKSPNFTVGFNETWYYKNMLALEMNHVALGIGGMCSYVDGGVLITPSSGGSNGYMWRVYDERLAQVAQQSQLGINGKADNLANCTVLVIGDSTVEQDKMTQGMLELFAERGKTLTLLGSRGTSPNLHEGRAGWSAYDYCMTASKGSVPNLFYNPTTGKFDFSYYMNNQGYSSPDFVVIQLGINDLYNKSFMDSESIIGQTVGYVSEIIASIKAFRADQKILLNLPTAINDDQKKHYVGIAFIRNMFIRYNTEIQLAVTLDSNIRCSYCHLILDPENDISDNVHPTTAGYQKMAAEVVSQINCWQQA